MGAANLRNASAVFAEMQSPEYAGYRPVGGLFAGPTDIRPLYQSVNSIAVYDARLLTPVASLFKLATVKFEGAQGFAPAAFFMSATGLLSEIYMRPTGSTVTFEYSDIVLDPFSNQTSSAFLAQLNSLGSNGYCELRMGDDTTATVVRMAGTTSQCRYEVVKPGPGGLQVYIDELNAQGARGFIPFLEFPLDNEGAKRIYVKNLSRSQAFGYYKLPDVPLPADASMLARHNEEGAKGASIYNITFGGANVTLYRVATECSSLLC